MSLLRTSPTSRSWYRRFLHQVSCEGLRGVLRFPATQPHDLRSSSIVMYFCISLSMLAFVSLALLARCSPLVAGLPVCSLLTVSEVSEVLTARSRRAIVAAGLAAVEGATTAAAAREPVVAAAWAVWNDQQSSEARCGHTDRRCSEVPPIMQVDEICHARERWSFPQAKG